jgi:hypothetical protein
MESLASGVAGTLAPQGVELFSERFATSLACEVFEVCANHGIEGRPSLAGNLTCAFYDIFGDRERQVHFAQDTCTRVTWQWLSREPSYAGLADATGSIPQRFAGPISADSG